jgi:formamidopyrimidine-DNA glycosylase
MPELPEVETIARALRPDLIGRTILDADVRWARTLAMPSAKKFREQIRSLRIRSVGRRAKFLNLELAAEQGARDQTYHLLIHLRMSGDLAIKVGKIIPEKHDRLILTLSGGKFLIFNDPRKFGRVWLTQDLDKVVGRLGPEPLSTDFTPKWLYDALQSRHRQLKPLLLDQTFLAGLGNIYTDEALHIAKLHPLTASNLVTTRQAKKLYGAISNVLQEGILRNGASIDWVYRGGDFQNHFRVYDREGQPCPVCGATIQRIVVGQRGTHICPDCQREGTCSRSA